MNTPYAVDLVVPACAQTAVVEVPVREAVPAFKHAKPEIVPPVTTTPSESKLVTVLVALNAIFAPALTTPVAALPLSKANPEYLAVAVVLVCEIQPTDVAPTDRPLA